MSFRKRRQVDHAAFEADIIEAMTETYAPEREAALAIKPRAPWYTEEIAEAKRSRRSLEKQWKRTNLTVHYDLFKQQRNKVTY